MNNRFACYFFQTSPDFFITFPSFFTVIAIVRANTVPHDASFQSYLKVIGIRKLTGGYSVRGEIWTKGKCRVLGTEPIFRRFVVCMANHSQAPEFMRDPAIHGQLLSILGSAKRLSSGEIGSTNEQGSEAMKTIGTTIAGHKVVSREQWHKARKKLLQKEKESTRLRDQLSAERRKLPWVKVEKQYMFDAPQGKMAVADLFDGRNQLVIYHFMSTPTPLTGAASSYSSAPT
jgi:Bacterial protein of unknown function (DUF899)